MIGALAIGAVTGLGMWLVVYGVWPPRPSLAAALQALEPARPALTPIVAPAAEDTAGFMERLGRPLARGLLRWTGEADWIRRGSLSADLAVLGRTPDRHLAEKLAAAVGGLFLPTVAMFPLIAAGVVPPLAVPLGLGILMAVAGFFVPNLAVRDEARKRRREVRHALAVFTDLVSLSLAGSNGVETALADAAQMGDGWAFTQIRRALNSVRYTQEAPWAALARLGKELGVERLEEMALGVSLALEYGAEVRLALLEQASSMRSQLLAESERDAGVATEVLSLPVVLLVVGFLLFIGVPAMIRLFTISSIHH